MTTAIDHRAVSRIPDIEILRGISVIFVVVHHAHGNLITQPHPWFDLFYSYFGLGIGVDIFFAVSGFVIARQLVPKLLACETQKQKMGVLSSFWLRRCWRLWPSAWLWLMLILLASIFLNRSEVFGSFRANYEATIAGVLQVANFRFADAFGKYFYGASFPYWSLSLEEQFYFVFPFLVLIAGRRLPWVLLTVVAVQLIMPRGLLALALRTDALACGALIAWLEMQPNYYRLFEPRFMRRKFLRWPILIILLMFIGSLGAATIHVVPYGFSLISILAAILVFFASYNSGYVDVPAPIREVLLWIGSRSYTLYLVHIPSFFLTRETFYRLAQLGIVDDQEHWVKISIAFIIFAVALVEATYRYVEMPCRLYGARIAKKYEQLSKESVF